LSGVQIVGKVSPSMELPLNLEIEGERRPHASRRLGDDYQDIVGVGFLLELVTRPDDCLSVRFEHDDVGALDDVVVERRDRWEYVQVKYAVDSGQSWSVDDLMVPARSKGTSLLRKWATAWDRIRAHGGRYAIRVVTNRTPDAELAALLETDRGGFATARFQSNREAAANAVMAATGLPEDQAHQFLRELRFSFGQPMLESLRRETQAGFDRIGTTLDGWASLLQSLRRWVFYTEPANGVRAGDVRLAARLWDPTGRELSQRFANDTTIHIVNATLLEALRPSAATAAGRYVLVTGPPGAGKSSFLSAFADQFGSDQNTVQAVIRHHCFVGVDDDQYYNRLRADVAVRDIFRQLYSAFSNDLRKSEHGLRVENPGVRDLAAWLRVCAEAARQNGRQLVVVLDGLDHALDLAEEGQLRELLSALPVPAPPGLYCLFGSQPRDQLLPTRLRQAVAAEHQCIGFDAEAVRAYASAYLGFEPTDELAAALLEVSGGNPLHLHYLVRQAPETGADRPEWVRSVPPCGTGVREYYQKLWDQLPDTARVLSVVLSELAFPFPADEIVWLMGRAGHSAADSAEAIRRTDHLTRRDAGNIQLYHTSLQAFLGDLSDAALLKRTALMAIRDWVVGPGGDAVRWSYEWEYELRLGNPRPLLEGTTTDWVHRSLAELRPPRRIRDLLTTASSESVRGGNLPSAYTKGALLLKLQELVDFGEQTALESVREVGVMLRGVPDAARVALDRHHAWNSPSLCALARQAAVHGEADVCADVFELVQDRHSQSDRIDEHQLIHLYRAAACANVSPDRIAKHCARTRGADSEAVQPWLRSYTEELAFLRNDAALWRLCSCDELARGERAVAIDAWCDTVLRIGGEQRPWPRGVEDLVMAGASHFAAWYRATLGLGIPADDLLPGFPQDLNLGVPWFGRDAGWRAVFEQTFWHAARLAARGDELSLREFEERLARDPRERARALQAIVDLGKLAARAVGGTEWSVAEACHIADRLSWPVYWANEDREFRELFDKLWLGLLRRAWRMARGCGRTVTLSAADIHRIWIARGHWPALVQLLDDALLHGWMSDEQICAAVDWIEAQVLAWRDSFPTRAEALAALGTIAAKAAQSDRATRLVQLAVASLLGYGFHKDITLHTTLDLVGTMHRERLGDAAGSLRRLEPLVEAVQDTTDGDETRHLPVELFNVLIDVEPSRAPGFLLRLTAQEEWYDLERCMASLLEKADIGDENVRALGRTCGSPQEVEAFAPRWQAWIEAGCPEGDRQAERTRFKNWHGTVRGSVSQDDPESNQLSRTPSAETDDDGAPATPAALLEMVESNTATRGIGRSETIAARIADWFGAAAGPAERDLLLQIAQAWIDRGDDYQADISDALWKACLDHGHRELAFSLLAVAQGQGRGWTRYWSSSEKSLDRQNAVLQTFPERALRFVLDSLARAGFRYGIGEPSLVVGFLARAGLRDIATRLATERVAFVESLFPHYPLRPCEWASTDLLPGMWDVLSSRVHHPEACVRVSAANEVSEVGDPGRAAAALLAQLRAAAHDGACLGAWLALLLLLQKHPSLPGVADALDPIRRDGASFARMLAREGLELLGAEPVLAPVPTQTDVAVAGAPPEWFVDTLERTAIWHRLDEWSATAREKVVAVMFAEATRLGLDQRRVWSLEQPVRSYTDRDVGFVPHDSKLLELLLGCYSIAVDHAAPVDGLNSSRVQAIAKMANPFDTTFASVVVRPRPDWVPEPENLDRFYSGGVKAVPLVDWTRVLLGRDRSRVLSCNLRVRHAASAESTVILPFLYDWDGPDEPDPRSVFRCLSEACCVRSSPSIAEYRDLLTHMCWESPEFPVSFGGLTVRGVVARHRPRVRRWHAAQGYFEPHLIMPGTPFSRGSQGPILNAELSYSDEKGTAVANGYFWQHERFGRIHHDLGMSGGFVLEATRGWLDAQVHQLGLRLAWVRQTKLRYSSRYRDEKGKEETSYHFHELSRLILP
jgi:Cdc6-like AAA superfamily ATPase